MYFPFFVLLKKVIFTSISDFIAGIGKYRRFFVLFYFSMLILQPCLTQVILVDFCSFYVILFISNYFVSKEQQQQKRTVYFFLSALDFVRFLFVVVIFYFGHII